MIGEINGNNIIKRKDLNEPCTKGEALAIIGEVRKIRKDIKEDMGDVIDEKIKTHQVSCPSSQIMDLQERGLIDDAGEFARDHPLFTLSSLSTVVAAVFTLIRGFL